MLIENQNQGEGDGSEISFRQSPAFGVPNAAGVDLSSVLNGAPYEKFRKEVALDVRRSQGTFFTAPLLAERTARELILRTGITSKVVDPCVGMGDLLLAYARHLPIGSRIEDTLADWGEILHGMDICGDLARTARLRLKALALYRHGLNYDELRLSGEFPNIKAGDFFDNVETLADSPAIFVNPPFQQSRVKERLGWSSGQVSMAAVFLSKLLENVGSSTSVMAILPEVLRCGSRYARLREHIASLGFGGQFISHGRFDQHADVDVFSTLLSRDELSGVWAPAPRNREQQVLSDKFEIRIGPVVPHRAKNKGAWRKYICAKSVPLAAESFEPRSSLRFTGTVFDAPFVVLRRTSGPSDKRRSNPTTIVSDGPVAVENHLVVLLPKDRENRIASCQAACKVLKNERTQNYLNTEMRCRHLTKTVVENIPWSHDD